MDAGVGVSGPRRLPSAWLSETVTLEIELCFSRRLAIGAFAGLTMLTTAIAAPLMTMDDYETIPPKHSDVEAKLSSSATTLGKAIEAALKSTGGGVAESAMFATDADGRPMIDVAVFNNGEKMIISINPSEGVVMKSTKVRRFPGEPVSGDWVETASGLKYYDIVKGTGENAAERVDDGQGALQRLAGGRHDVRQFRAAWSADRLPVEPRDCGLDGRCRFDEGRRQAQADHSV